MITLDRNLIQGIHGVWGVDDASPMPPMAYWDHLSPSWARVWVEVVDRERDSRVPWKDDRVLKEWLRLTGFHPKQFEFASDLAHQQRALRVAREVVDALYIADEVQQLDGQPALDFAHGWMNARYFLLALATCSLPDGEACGGRWCPPADAVAQSLARAIELHQPAYAANFSDGFHAHLVRVLDPEKCGLRCKR